MVPVSALVEEEASAVVVMGVERAYTAAVAVEVLAAAVVATAAVAVVTAAVAEVSAKVAYCTRVDRADQVVLAQAVPVTAPVA